ncbi:hypothetical protein [Thermogutta sp.]|uniref:hypothetical protein n=1 Tax=Thermogutta sp. TaxID=1962930 RepID=UPI003C7CDB0E
MTLVNQRIYVLAGMALLVALGQGLQSASTLEATEAAPANLWDLCREKSAIHRFATLFSAQDVRDHLATEEGRQRAMEWCRATGVTHVFIESFRNGYQAPRDLLTTARDTFSQAGFKVSGCVTPTNVGKLSTGWKLISCCTDLKTQDRLAGIFAYTASLFDEIMIDDFLFTDCTCPECQQARTKRTVRIGDQEFPVNGDSWSEYRCELMVQLSRIKILQAARKVNRNVQIIIKYPQWYDYFHERGYDVIRQTTDFDRIWVGTETRDYDDPRWGRTVQYEGYFIMRWLGGIGGDKCGGGWFDPLGTTEHTYVEQARQTVLGGARETLLFCYGALQRGTGPRNVEVLRAHIPELLDVAEKVRRRQIIGVAAYKPPHSPPGREPYVYDFVGMLGIPLVPCHEFPENAQAAFFSVHALTNSQFEERLAGLVERGVPILLTDALAGQLKNRELLNRPNVHVLSVQGDPHRLLQFTEKELEPLRAALLRPFGLTFKAPNKVGLYLFEDGSYVIENFNNDPVKVALNGKEHEIPGRGWIQVWK